MKIAATGATGYIGGRLLPRLIADGHEVVRLAGNPAKLADRSWTDQVEAVTADVLQPDTLEGTLRGCDVAFYLVHSMGSADSFRDADKAAATNFTRAAADAGVGRILYLGGLGEEDDRLSHHLDSRHEVGRALASGTVPVTEVRQQSSSDRGPSLSRCSAISPRCSRRWLRRRGCSLAANPSQSAMFFSI